MAADTRGAVYGSRLGHLMHSSCLGGLLGGHKGEPMGPNRGGGVSSMNDDMTRDQGSDRHGMMGVGWARLGETVFLGASCAEVGGNKHFEGSTGLSGRPTVVGCGEDGPVDGLNHRNRGGDTEWDRGGAILLDVGGPGVPVGELGATWRGGPRTGGLMSTVAWQRPFLIVDRGPSDVHVGALAIT